MKQIAKQLKLENVEGERVTLQSDFKIISKVKTIVHQTNKDFMCFFHTKMHAISSYKDHLYKDQALKPPEFKDHQYWILKN